MICFPNAKINLGLHVTTKRSDGFHDLETIFYPIDLKDALEFVESKELIFQNTGLPIDAPLEQNLVVKAWKLLHETYNIPPVSIHLHKVIPFGAGLGGGSADAAFMLNALNEYFKLNIPILKLQEYATQLGSDCAFFITNRPAFASGRGEILEEITVSLQGLQLIIVNPGIHVPTKEAFAAITPKQPLHSLREVIQRPIYSWKDELYNDFEQSIFPQHPAIAAIKVTLYKQGALYAAMTGSGSSVYGIFEQSIHVKELFSSNFCWTGSL